MDKPVQQQAPASIWPGLAVCLLLGAAAWALGRWLPVVGRLVGGPVFAIALGIVLGQLWRPAALRAGIAFAGKKVLQGSIVLIGFGLNLSAIIRAGGQSLLVMACTMAAALLCAYFLGRALRVDGNIATLIGVGTAICGGSAIAATAPVIRAKEKEVAYSVSTIFLFNIAAVFLFPPLGRLLGLGQLGFGMWAGTAINDTSSVVAAGYAFGDAAGDFATIVKLTRTLMILPVTLVLALWQARRSQGQPGYRLGSIFPWFVLGFLGTALLNSTGLLPAAAAAGLNSAGKFGIMVAMAGIGLGTDVRALIKNGPRPVLLGLACWASVAVVSLAVQRLLGQW